MNQPTELRGQEEARQGRGKGRKQKMAGPHERSRESCRALLGGHGQRNQHGFRHAHAEHGQQKTGHDSGKTCGEVACHGQQGSQPHERDAEPGRMSHRCFFDQAAAGHGAQHNAAAGDAEDEPECVGREAVNALVEVRAPRNIGEEVEEDGRKGQRGQKKALVAGDGQVGFQNGGGVQGKAFFRRQRFFKMKNAVDEGQNSHGRTCPQHGPPSQIFVDEAAEHGSEDGGQPFHGHEHGKNACGGCSMGNVADAAEADDQKKSARQPLYEAAQYQYAQGVGAACPEGAGGKEHKPGQQRDSPPEAVDDGSPEKLARA